MDYQEKIVNEKCNKTLTYDEVVGVIARKNEISAEHIKQCFELSDYQGVVDKIKGNASITQEEVIAQSEQRMLMKAEKAMISEMQETLNKVEKGILENYEKIVDIIVKRYAERTPLENKIKVSETIRAHAKPLDYQGIVIKAKAKISETYYSRLQNYKEIIDKMKNEVITELEREIMMVVERENNDLGQKIREKEEEAKLRSASLLKECAQPCEQGRGAQKRAARSLDKKMSDKFGKLSEELTAHNNTYESLKEGTSSTIDAEKKEIISQIQETMIKIMDRYQKYQNKSQEYKLRSHVFYIINSHIASELQWEQFIVDNFSKIIQFGFKDEEPTEDLYELMEKITDKLIIDGKPQHNFDMEDNYQHVLGQHKEVSDKLEKLKKGCNEKRLYKDFYIFVDFIYNSKKKKEEQDREKKLESERIGRELLEEESKETGAKPKQPQWKKKKKKTKNDNGSKTIINDKEISKPEVQNGKEEVKKTDEEVKELRGELKELRESLFPNEKLKQFEDKVNQAIENHEESLKATNVDDEKIKDLYVIKVSFNLCRAMLHIKNYNGEYGKIIGQTKGNFGTSKFSPKYNRYITSNLIDIALMVQNIDTDLKEVISVIDKITCLIYKDYDQQSDETWLEMISQENFEWMSKFLDHLKALGEWHSNKMEAIRNLGIVNKKKTPEQRKEEAEALKTIKSCVDSLDIFISKSGCTQDSNSVENDRKSLLGYYGPHQSWEYFGPHQKWCALSNVNIEKIYELPIEVRNCSCS